jgi:anti-sigma factor (TIGR02949 family)
MGFLDRLKKLMGSDGEDAAPGQITCMEALERVHEYLDGELDGVSHEEVAQHFAMCQRCYPHLQLEERFREVLQRVEAEAEAPQQLKEQVLELLAAEADGGD